jgi:inosine triphosphate pyrophosphatase
MQNLTIITGNAGKAREFQQLLGDQFLVTNQKYDIPEIQGTPSEIAINKAIHAAQKFDTTVVIEDTCLFLKEYGEQTGSLCKWLAVDKFGKNDDPKKQCDNFNKMAIGCQDKTLIAKCIIAMCSPGEEPKLFEGTYEGVCCDFSVGKPADGMKYFGWDPIMFDTASGKSFAQMSAEDKNSISHRRRAVDKFVSYLKESCVAKQKPKMVLVTGNGNKVKEFNAILGDKFEITNKKFNLIEIQGTPLEVIRDKAQRAAKEFDMPIVVEDTCLYLQQYGACTGAFCKWFGTTLNTDGTLVESAELQCKNFYRMSIGCENKTLIAICLIAYCEPGKEPLISLGKFEGYIDSFDKGIPSEKDAKYFGWDPIMFDTVTNLSFAQMTPEKKNDISHRRKALDAFVEQMSNYAASQ